MASVSDQLIETLSRTGVEFEPVSTVGGSSGFRAKEFERGKGFQFEILESSIQHIVIFSIERFAADLAQLMHSQVIKEILSLDSPKFQSILASSLTIRVNGASVPDLKSALQITTWRNLSLMVTVDKPTQERELKEKLDSLLTMVLLVLPYEDEAEEDLSESEFSIEGGKRSGIFNSYERSSKNRRICLAVHGFSCKTCGVSLGEKYGELGEDFIHVHHTTPVSQMGEPRPVNPYTELIPVCPNCHYMMHRKDPPVTPEELIRQIRQEPTDLSAD
jgi:5-methylcytosine-specific restriction protein A